MSETDARAAIMHTFGKKITGVVDHNDRRTYITVAPENVPAVSRFMFADCGGRLCTVTGIDTRGGIEILYHFMFPKDRRVITLKTLVKKPELSIESIGTFMPAAIWIERELHDILGVTFTGHPDPRRLIMADDWPEGVYPLRRDFKEPPK